MTISDKKLAVDSDNDGVINYYNADVVTASDYYPGGMHMPGRDYSITGKRSRHSINGQERSNELNDNLTTALFWEYDSRILRRWNIDPVTKDWESPYLCFSGNPIQYSDILGNTATDKGKKKGSSTRDSESKAVVGTKAHETLSNFLKAKNVASGKERYKTRVILNSGLKPDIVDDEKKQVWELKPLSYSPQESYSKYLNAKAQLGDYVTEINAGGAAELVGNFGAGGTFFDKPIADGTPLTSLDGKQTFTFTTPNYLSGIIYYSVTDNKKKPDDKKDRKVKTGVVVGDNGLTTAITVVAAAKVVQSVVNAQKISTGAKIVQFGVRGIQAVGVGIETVGTFIGSCAATFFGPVLNIPGVNTTGGGYDYNNTEMY